MREGFIEDKHIDKVDRLRKEREVAREAKNKFFTTTNKVYSFNIGDSVNFKINGKTIGGIIHQKNKDETYNITSALGYFKNIERYVIWTRKVRKYNPDLSNEHLKKISTNRLMQIKKSYAYSIYCVRYYDDVYMDIEYSTDIDILVPNVGLVSVKYNEILNELCLRENILSKEDKKLIKNIK